MKKQVFFFAILTIGLFLGSCTNDSDLQEIQELEELENVQSIEKDEFEEDDI